MKTHLEFTSTAFPAYPGEDKDINPGIFGKRLIMVVLMNQTRKCVAGTLIKNDNHLNYIFIIGAG